MVSGIQDTVFEVIKFAKQSGLRHITKKQIKEELLNTEFGKFDKEYWENDKNSKLDRMLDQALYQLSKNNKIKKRGKGRYTIEKFSKKYKPIICKHLETREKGPYCPIKKCYIGDPKLQCEVLHGTNHSTMTKQIIPMCPGYIRTKPTKLYRSVTF